MKFGRNFFSRKAASLTEAQKEELARWEADICGDSVVLRSAVNQEYHRLLEILGNRKTELQQLRKESLEECFFTNKSNQDKDLKFGQNFFSRKAASLTEAQKEELARWEADICGGSVALRSAVNKEYNRLLEILENRKTELQQLAKESLEECFFTNKSNQDKDLQFGRNFFRRKSALLTEAEKDQLAEFEVEICKTVNFDDFNRFVSVLRDRAQDLAALRCTDFTSLLSCRQPADKDFKFCRAFWRRNASRLNGD